MNASNVSLSTLPITATGAIIPWRQIAPITETFLPQFWGRLPGARLPFSDRADKRVKARLIPVSSMEMRLLAKIPWMSCQNCTHFPWTFSLAFSSAWNVFLHVIFSLLSIQSIVDLLTVTPVSCANNWRSSSRVVSLLSSTRRARIANCSLFSFVGVYCVRTFGVIDPVSRRCLRIFCTKLLATRKCLASCRCEMGSDS